MDTSDRNLRSSDAVSPNMGVIKGKFPTRASRPTQDAGRSGSGSDATSNEDAIVEEYLGKAAAQADQASQPAAQPADNYEDEAADRVRQSQVTVKTRSTNIPQGADPVAPTKIAEIWRSGTEIGGQG